jgi:hypothetical protein
LGSIFITTDKEVLQSVAQEKWDKAEAQLYELVGVLDSLALPKFSNKQLGEIRGFMCHVSMIYLLVNPNLKGFHFTLVAHHSGHDDSEGWKLTPQEWAAYLYKALATGKMVYRLRPMP